MDIWTAAEAAYKNGLEKGRAAARIPYVLEVISEIWADHPDLRLGQLILNAVDEKSLYYLEDDELLATLRAEYENFYGAAAQDSHQD